MAERICAFASAYGVSQKLVSAIKHGDTWRELQEASG